MYLLFFPSAAPTSVLAPTGSSFRVLTETPCKRGRCFQMRPDAKTQRGGWPLWVWRGGVGGMEGGQEMSEDRV